MYTVFIILIVIASVLLTFFVLVQNSKGGGLAAGFSSSNQIMGVRKTTDFLEKATWGLVAFIVVLSVASSAIKSSKPNADNSLQQVKEEVEKAKQSVPGAVAPNFGENPANAQKQQQPVKGAQQQQQQAPVKK